jgi:hypothetical protein
MIEGQKKTLDDRAEAARTFDEVLQDLILMFKQQLLPFAQELKKGLGVPIQDMVKKWSQEGFFKTLRDFVKGAAEVVKVLGKWILNLMDFLGPKGTVIAGLTLALAGKAATWISNGYLLAQGFMRGTGGMGGGMGMSGAGKGFGVPGGAIGPPLPMSGMQKALGGNVMGGKFAAGTMGSMGLGLGLGMLGTGMQYGRSQMDNPESTAGKMLGVGGTAAQYAGMGAMLGPWGALAGGVLGLGVGAYDEFVTKNRDTHEGGSSSKLFESKDSIMYHPQDKFLKVNDGIQIAGTSVNGNAKLAQELSKNNSSAPGEMTHKFEDLKITIDVNIPGNEKLGSQLANTPEFIRRINEAINKEIAMAAGGGKLSGSGTKRSGK